MSKIAKTRLDHLLVQKGLVENSSKARARIMAGDVIVNDHRVDKPGEKFADDVDIRLRGNSHPFVSRGGLKLEYALEAWPCPLTEKICMDVGASTGGFTEVLLKSGAKKVYAIDVGYGQLAEKLRTDPRVVSLERTHILDIKPGTLSEPIFVAVIDVSFISLEKVLPKVVSLLEPSAYIYALVKPQFEVGREQIAKGGIVKDEAAQWAALDKIVRLAVDLKLTIRGVSPSPVLGTKGNVEFLLALRL